MKKLILLLGIVLMSLSCVNEPPNTYWYIENQTGQTLILKFPYSSSLFTNDSPHEYREIEIAPSDGVGLGWGPVGSPLMSYFEKNVEIFGENVSWQILSEDSTVLKTWKYSERDQPDQRFFDTVSWKYVYMDWSQSNGDLWSFRIQQSDIISE